MHQQCEGEIRQDLEAGQDKRRRLEWRQNQRDFATAKRNATFHYPRHWRRRAHVQTQVFETLILMEKHGLDVSEVENRSYHYRRTVDQWQKNCEANWEMIQGIDPVRFGEKFQRRWLFYLGGASETFADAREIINCYHVTFMKGRRGRARERG